MASNTRDKVISVFSETDAAATVTSEPMNLGDYDQLVGFLSVTGAGTGTLDVVVQHSPDGTVWHTLQTFTQASGATTEVETSTIFGSFVRVVGTIAGGAPAFDFTMFLVAKRT